MKLSLKTKNDSEKTSKRTKPVDHFKKCPQCGATDLIQINPDVLCSSCDWDSTAWDVSRGAMDNLELAAKEIFKTKPVLISSYKKSEIKKTEPVKSNDINYENKKGA